MARQEGIIKKGTMEILLLQNQDGHLAREKGEHRRQQNQK
jgi:hypothetical protein